MTDKQIIIDGVDVSRCTCRYYAYNRHLCSLIGDDPCEEHSGCLYKQLKRKEQECERLASTLTDIKEIIHFNKTNRLSGGAYISIEQILQKINEVEDE